MSWEGGTQRVASFVGQNISRVPKAAHWGSVRSPSTLVGNRQIPRACFSCIWVHTHTRTHTHTHIRVNNCQEVFYLTLPYRLLLLFYLRIGPNPSLLVVREDWLVSWLSGWWEESFETSCRIGLNYQPSWLSCPGLSVSFEHTSNSRRDILDPSDDQIRTQI